MRERQLPNPGNIRRELCERSYLLEKILFGSLDTTPMHRYLIHSYRLVEHPNSGWPGDVLRNRARAQDYRRNADDHWASHNNSLDLGGLRKPGKIPECTVRRERGLLIETVLAPGCPGVTVVGRTILCRKQDDDACQSAWKKDLAPGSTGESLPTSAERS